MTKIYELSGIVKTDPDKPDEQDPRTEAAEALYGTSGAAPDPVAEITKYIGTPPPISDSSYVMIVDAKKRPVFTRDKEVITYFYQYRTVAGNMEIAKWREYDIKKEKTIETTFVPYVPPPETVQITSDIKKFDPFTEADGLPVYNYTTEEKEVPAPNGQPYFLEWINTVKIPKIGVRIGFTGNTSVVLSINTMIE